MLVRLRLHKHQHLGHTCMKMHKGLLKNPSKDGLYHEHVHEASN